MFDASFFKGIKTSTHVVLAMENGIDKSRCRAGVLHGMLKSVRLREISLNASVAARGRGIID
jgi:hypothetical protein